MSRTSGRWLPEQRRQPRTPNPGGTFLSAFKYNWNGVTIPVPGLFLRFNLDGRKLNITNQQAVWQSSFATSYRLCNWKIQYQNRTGSKIHSTYTTGTHSGCTWMQGRDNLKTDYKVKTGVQCARLFVQGYFRGEHCHAVFS